MPTPKRSPRAEDKYGFTVTAEDANRYDILEALNQMREKLTEQDNLLVYYAGTAN